jgi:uncharacterized protein (DUF169 family)
MSSKQRDYSIFDKFNFERKPVGVKYSLEKPDGIERLDKSLALCELFAEAQTSNKFYVNKDDIQCGEQIIGAAVFPPTMQSGQLGPRFSMFKDPSANRRIYEYTPMLSKDSVEYIIYSPVNQLTEDPDILIITANTTQAEIILRASSYSNGKMWSTRGTTCLACAWIYAYPYLSGELNYTVSGLGFSMKARQVLPEGLIIITVPFDMLPMLIENLEDMEWNPHWFSLGRDGFIKAVRELDEEMYQKFPDKAKKIN